MMPARSQFTIEESMEVRPLISGLRNRFNGPSFRGHPVNRVGPAYDKACSYGLPSTGNQRYAIILKVKLNLWEYGSYHQAYSY